MNSIILRIALYLALPAFMITSSESTIGQPHGWPCDYGLRRNNVWVYRSMSDTTRIHTETAVDDFIDPAGRYWVFISPSNAAGHWFRIDSSCTMDRFGLTTDTTFKHWFEGSAVVDARWTVDSVAGMPPTHAWLTSMKPARIANRQVTSRQIIYYPGNADSAWYEMNEYAMGIGMVGRWRPESGYEELVGMLIDGVSYGYVIDLDVTQRNDSKSDRITIRPSPASDHAMLEFMANADGRATIDVHDMLGRLVCGLCQDGLADGLNHIPFDLSLVPSGHYFCIVTMNGLPAARLPILVVH